MSVVCFNLNGYRLHACCFSHFSILGLIFYVRGKHELIFLLLHNSESELEFLSLLGHKTASWSLIEISLLYFYTQCFSRIMSGLLLTVIPDILLFWVIVVVHIQIKLQEAAFFIIKLCSWKKNSSCTFWACLLTLWRFWGSWQGCESNLWV